MSVQIRPGFFFYYVLKIELMRIIHLNTILLLNKHLKDNEKKINKDTISNVKWT